MAVEHIAYILGAGFTAPLGLPVMKDFLRKARDLYATRPEECAFFGDVFKQIEWLGKIKSYYNSDLLNIEDILAIFEMNSSLSGRRKHLFEEFIRTVIALLTPPVSVTAHDPEEVLGDSWQQNIFRAGDPIAPYASFLCCIQNMIVRPEYFFTLDIHRKYLSFRRNPDPRAVYSVITVNYDTVLENICAFIGGHMLVDSTFRFFRTAPARNSGDVPALSRLHGSIATDVLPPLWNKPPAPGIRDAWRLAGETLRKANQIRFIGYSLAGAEPHLKTLFGSPLTESPHLERVDILCLDDERGTVERRYRELHSRAATTFVNGDAGEYLKLIHDVHAGSRLRRRNDLYFDHLEQAHSKFFGR